MVITSLENSASSEDSYIASIELSNSCRQFFLDRQNATERFKENVFRKEKTKSSLDSSMDRLRNEMAGLMEQDLTLMEQLLTMNEKIEELKFQTYHSTKEDFDSSTSLSNSEEGLCEASDLRTPSAIEDKVQVYDLCESLFADEMETGEVKASSAVSKSWKSLHYIKQDSVDSGYEDDTDSSDDCCLSDAESL